MSTDPSIPRIRVVGGGPMCRPVLFREPVFDHPNAPHLTALRKRYGLLDVAGQGSDFDRARRLKTWVRKCWDHGFEPVAPTENAMRILRRAERGEQFNCGVYTQVFTECALAVGLTTRRIALSIAGTDYPTPRRRFNHGHHVVDVHCRELGKWVMLDADTNCFYTLNDEPCGALALHQAWHDGRADNIKQVGDRPAFVQPPGPPLFTSVQMRKIWDDFNRYCILDYYYYVSTWWRHGKPRASDDRRVWFAGRVHPPVAQGFVPTDLDRQDRVTAPSDFDWPINQTFIQAALPTRRVSRQVRVTLDHNMPAFDHFELRVGTGPYRRLPKNTRLLTLTSGLTTVQARCVDGFGRPGLRATLKLSLR